MYINVMRASPHNWRAVAIALSCLCSGFSVSHAETVTIRADAWYPVNGQPGSDRPGYMIELASTILAGHGYSVDYQTMPWERAVDSVRKGKYDCVVGAFRGDTPDFVFPRENWGRFATWFYTRAGNPWRYTGLDSLRKQTIGIIGGYAYGDALDNFIQQNSSRFHALKGEAALENNIEKLLAGRISVIAEAPLVMNAKLKELGLQGKVRPAGRLNEGEAVYIACSPAKPRSRRLVDWFDAGIKALRRSGELAKILAKYAMTDWKTQQPAAE